MRWRHCKSVILIAQSCDAHLSPRDGRLRRRRCTWPAYVVLLVSGVPVRALPSASGVAWIPFLDRDAPFTNPETVKFLSSGHFFARTMRKLVFKLGNPEPLSGIFRDKQSFEAFLRTKDYRAAIGLWNVTVPIPYRGKIRVRVLALPPAATKKELSEELVVGNWVRARLRLDRRGNRSIHKEGVIFRAGFQRTGDGLRPGSNLVGGQAGDRLPPAHGFR